MFFLRALAVVRALLVAYVLVAVDMLFIFLLILFFIFKLFSSLVLGLHQLLKVLNLLRVQFVSVLLRHCNQVRRDLIIFIFLVIIVVLDGHFVVATFILLLILGNDFCNFAVNLVVKVLLGVLLVVVLVNMMALFPLRRIYLLGCGNCILNVERDFIFVCVLVVAEILQITVVFVFLFVLLLARASFLWFRVTHQLVELLVVEFLIVALAVLDIDFDVFVIQHTFSWQHTSKHVTFLILLTFLISGKAA